MKGSTGEGDRVMAVWKGIFIEEMGKGSLEEQPEWFANPNPPEDGSGLKDKLPKELLERPLPEDLEDATGETCEQLSFMLTREQTRPRVCVEVFTGNAYELVEYNESECPSVLEKEIGWEAMAAEGIL